MAIFVIVADDLDDNHPRTINILIAAGYQIAMVNNRGFHQPDAVPESVAFVIEGHNIGRDIVGCIRVLHTFGSCSVLAREARILFLNDPVISVPGARPVFERLAAASEDCVRVTEGFRGTRYVIPTEAEFDPPAAPPIMLGSCPGLKARDMSPASTTSPPAPQVVDRGPSTTMTMKRRNGHDQRRRVSQPSAAMVRHAAFRRWADRLTLISNRAYPIRAGEIRLSRYLLAAGVRRLVPFGGEYWSRLQQRASRSDSVPARIIPRHVAERYPKFRGRDRVAEADQSDTSVYVFGRRITGIPVYREGLVLSRGVPE